MACYRLLENTLNTVRQVDACLRVVPSSQLRDARSAQTERTANDNLELLLSNEVDPVGSLLREQGRQ